MTLSLICEVTQIEVTSHTEIEDPSVIWRPTGRPSGRTLSKTPPPSLGSCFLPYAYASVVFMCSSSQLTSPLRLSSLKIISCIISFPSQFLVFASIRRQKWSENNGAGRWEVGANEDSEGAKQHCGDQVLGEARWEAHSAHQFQHQYYAGSRALIRHHYRCCQPCFRIRSPLAQWQGEWMGAQLLPFLKLSLALASTPMRLNQWPLLTFSFIYFSISEDNF